MKWNIINRLRAHMHISFAHLRRNINKHQTIQITARSLCLCADCLTIFSSTIPCDSVSVVSVCDYQHWICHHIRRFLMEMHLPPNVHDAIECLYKCSRDPYWRRCTALTQDTQLFQAFISRTVFLARAFFLVGWFRYANNHENEKSVEFFSLSFENDE